MTSMELYLLKADLQSLDQVFNEWLQKWNNCFDDMHDRIHKLEIKENLERLNDSSGF